MSDTNCVECGAAFERRAYATGYAVRQNGERICYRCATWDELTRAKETGKATLYITEDWEVLKAFRKVPFGRVLPAKAFSIGNWPGLWKLTPTQARSTRRGYCGNAVVVRFRLFGEAWSGVQCGESNQILRCRRVKGA